MKFLSTVTLFAMIASPLAWPATSADSVYETARGEQRTVRFSQLRGTDGLLNTDSRIVVGTDREGHQIRLLRGEVFLARLKEDVPVTINVGGWTISHFTNAALNVRRYDAQRADVVLSNGCAVLSSPSGRPLRLCAHTLAQLERQSVQLRPLSHQEMFDKIVWRRGSIPYAQGATVQDVFDEFARYVPVRLVAHDAIRHRRIGGQTSIESLRMGVRTPVLIICGVLKLEGTIRWVGQEWVVHLAERARVGESQQL